MAREESRYHQLEFDDDAPWGNYLERAQAAIERDWLVVGNDFFKALLELAEELGGLELAKKVRELAELEEGFPNPAALTYLIEKSPDAGERVMERFKQIGANRRKAELEEVRKRESALDASLFSHIALWFAKIFQSTTETNK